MRGRSAFVSLAGVLSFALCARVAWATDCSGILAPCINDDTMWPHGGPAFFEVIGGTETVGARQLGFALASTYLSRPIVLGSASPGGSGTDQYVVNDQVNATFLWSYGVTDRLELDLGLPITLGQGGTGLAPVTGGNGLKDTALRDMRFGFAYAIVPHARVAPETPSRPWGLAGRFEVSAPSGDRGQFAGEGWGVFAPSLAGDVRSGRWFAGAEIGARIRPTTQLLQARVGSQIVTALGVGFHLLPRELLSAEVEAWALPTLVQQASVLRRGDAYG